MAKPGLPPPALLDPGWYPDPTGRYEARFWDGRKWTSNISHYGATGADPLHRSRWNDRLRPRWLFQLLLLVVVAGAVAALAWRFWPEPDERDLEADGQIAASAALRIDDVPAGWAADGNASLVTPIDPLIKFVEEAFSACAHFEEFTSLGTEPRQENAFGSADNLTSATNRVLVAETNDQAERYIDALRNDDTADCLSALVERETVAGTENTLEDVRVTVLDPPAFGDEAAWYRVEGIVSGGLFPVNVAVDLVTIRVERSLAEFSFFGQFERVGVAVQRDAIRPVSQRLDELHEPETADE